MNMKSLVFLVCVALPVVLCVQVGDAATVKTKTLYREMQRSKEFMTKQHTVWTDFVSSLKKEDVAEINRAADYGGNKNVELYNTKAVAYYKELAALSEYDPRDVLYWEKPMLGLPRNFQAANILNVLDYEQIFRMYEIPVNDYEEAIEKFSDYCLDVLVKLQDLRDKVQSAGLKIYSPPTINKSRPGSDPWPLFLIHKSFVPSNQTGTQQVSQRIYGNWKRSTEKMLELYSIKSSLTTAKLWIEFLVNNEMTVDMHNKSNEPELLNELEKLETRLANVSAGGEATTQSTVKSPKQESSTATSEQKPKFKLELPK